MAEVSLQPKASGFSCLDRDHKERVEICFQEVEAYRKALDQERDFHYEVWQTIALATALGFVGGVYLDSRWHH
jgi:hypothetical protein